MKKVWLFIVCFLRVQSVFTMSSEGFVDRLLPIEVPYMPLQQDGSEDVSMELMEVVVENDLVHDGLYGGLPVEIWNRIMKDVPGGNRFLNELCRKMVLDDFVYEKIVYALLQKLSSGQLVNNSVANFREIFFKTTRLKTIDEKILKAFHPYEELAYQICGYVRDKNTEDLVQVLYDAHMRDFEEDSYLGQEDGLFFEVGSKLALAESGQRQRKAIRCARWKDAIFSVFFLTVWIGASLFIGVHDKSWIKGGVCFLILAVFYAFMLIVTPILCEKSKKAEKEWKKITTSVTKQLQRKIQEVPDDPLISFV